MLFKKISLLLFILFAANTAFGQQKEVKQIVSQGISRLEYRNTYVVPNDLKVNGTQAGGLSGIDYDPVTKTYYLICDDRSKLNPARLYTAKIDLTDRGIEKVMFTGADSLRQRDGSLYPPISPKAKYTSDPEAMRYNGATHQLIWTSEGERIVNSASQIIIDPSMNIISPDGRLIDSIPLPENLRMHKEQIGPRQNGVLEGLTFANDYKNLFVSMEEPLYEDGPRADLQKNNAFIRIYQFDLATKKNTAQYAYELEPIPFAPKKEGGAMNNGVPDILWLGKNQLMVIERAFAEGVGGSNIKVFIADLDNADNIIGLKGMAGKGMLHPAKKRLLLNMDDLGIYIDNIEGVTFGPVLPNGHQTLIFVADNNFNPLEQSQFILFEVIP